MAVSLGKRHVVRSTWEAYTDVTYSKEGAVVGGALLAYEHSKIQDFHQYLALRRMKTVTIRVELTFESDHIRPRGKLQPVVQLKGS